MTEDHGTAPTAILAEIQSSGERQNHAVAAVSNVRWCSCSSRQRFRAAGKHQAAALEQQSQLMAMLIQRLAEPSRRPPARPVTDLPLPQVSTPAPSSPDVETPPVSICRQTGVGLVGGASHAAAVEPNPRPQTLDLTPHSRRIAQQPFRGTRAGSMSARWPTLLATAMTLTPWLQNMDAVTKLAGWTPSNHALQIQLTFVTRQHPGSTTPSDTVSMDPQLLSKHLRETFWCSGR